MRGVEYVVSDDTQVSAPRAGPCSAARNGSCQSTSPETPSTTRRASRPQAHRRRAARRLERGLSGEGRNRPRRARRDLTSTPRNSRHGWRRACSRPSPSSRCPSIIASDAHLRPDGARRPAGAQAPHRQVRVLPNEESLERLVSAVLIEIDEMGRRRQGLHQMGML